MRRSSAEDRPWECQLHPLCPPLPRYETEAVCPWHWSISILCIRLASSNLAIVAPGGASAKEIPRNCYSFQSSDRIMDRRMLHPQTQAGSWARENGCIGGENIAPRKLGWGGKWKQTLKAVTSQRSWEHFQETTPTYRKGEQHPVVPRMGTTDPLSTGHTTVHAETSRMWLTSWAVCGWTRIWIQQQNPFVRSNSLYFDLLRTFL